jgi:Protein of unknown function (DUF3141)
MDILRQRGNQHNEMVLHGVSSVLIYDSELIMRGDELAHPVNYSLLRIIPPEGEEVDDRKRLVFVIDPRAGQGPGIGGLKHMSEIGDAFRAGHPVYFAGFMASPVEGQRIEDVARAFTIFIEKVAELHPKALGCSATARPAGTRCLRRAYVPMWSDLWCSRVRHSHTGPASEARTPCGTWAAGTAEAGPIA